MTASTLDERAGSSASEPSRRIRLRVLGPLAVEVDGDEVHVAGTHRRRLLALLASRPGRTVSTDAIVDGLWDFDDVPPSANKTIQAHVMRLRRSLREAGDVIATVPHGYRLDVDPAVVDAVCFESLVGAARQASAHGDARAAAEHLAEALELWRGAAYSEFPDASFATAERARLEEMRLAALEDRAAADLALGNVAVAIAALEQLVAEEPGREGAWALLMGCLYAAGRQHDSLQVYDRARRALADHYGLEPGPELRRLERRVLDQDPTLFVAGNRASAPAALRTTTPLVGRTTELAVLRESWQTARRGDGQVVVLSGPTDSGRTRLAAALAAGAVDDGGFVEYVRGGDGPAALLTAGSPTAPGAAVDAITERCRRGPVLLVIDDAERLPASALPALEAIATATERLSLLLVVVVDDGAGGHATGWRDQWCRVPTNISLALSAMTDAELQQVVLADGVEPDGVAAILAISGGRPGVARREAAAWAERAAGDRLQVAASSSLDAAVDADRARESVHDEVLALVAARARRDELLSQSWVGRQPFRALASYGAEDADLFVGRERLTAELAARVLDRRLVAVVGPSGSGKSSLVRAGLVPLVRSGRLPGGTAWRTHLIVPGHDPIAALDGIDGLDEPGPQLVVVDQFEEVVGTDAATGFATRLVALVLDAALDVHVVIVLRADQYAALAAMRPLCDLVEDATTLVGTPTNDELRRIVEVPARRTGCVVEPALVERVVRDVGDHDAALPLVSAALADAWEHRRADALTLEHYLRSGGLANAVERLGEDVLERADVDAVRDVMLRLVDVTEEGHWVRRRAAGAETPAHLDPALDALVDARLVHRGDTEIEVVHEVVFTAWPRLVGWLDDARADLVTDRWLRAAAVAWEDGGRSDDDAPRGARLVAASELLTRRPDAPVPVRELVEAGRRAAAAEHELAEAQRIRDARARRRLTGALGIAAVLLVVALVGSVVAVRNGRQANDERRNAVDTAAAAMVARLVAESDRELDSHLDLAFLLAAEAYDHTPSPETKGALLTALTHNLSAERSYPGAGPDEAGHLVRSNSSFAGFISGAPAISLDVDVSDDGRIVAAGGRPGQGSGGLAVVFDTTTRQALQHVTTEGPVNFVDVSADGTFALVCDESGVLQRLDVNTGARTRFVSDPPRYFERGVIAGEDRVVGVTNGGLLQVWDASGHAVDVTTPDGTLWIEQVAPDGTLLLRTMTNWLYFWDVDDGGVPRRVHLESGGAEVGRVVVSSDGAWIAGAERDGGRVFIWDAATGGLVGDASRRPGTARGLAFAPSSTPLLAIASAGGGVSLYDVASDRMIGEPLRGHGSGARDVEFSASGDWLLTVADDGLLGLWEPNDLGGPIGSSAAAAAAVLEAHADDRVPDWIPADQPVNGTFSPDGSRFVSVDRTNTHVVLQDAVTGAQLGDAWATGVLVVEVPQFTPDGRFVDVILEDRLVRFDAYDLVETTSVPTPFAVEGELAHVPGTDEVIAAGLNGYVGRFDLRSGAVVGIGRSRDSSNLEGAALSGDGTLVATYHPHSFRVALFDAATLRPIGRPFLAGDFVFHPRFTDDGMLAGYGLFNAPTFWDVGPEVWRDAVCRRAGRNLTHGEWTQYVGDEPYRATCEEWPAAG